MMVIFRGYLFCNVGSFWWSINSFQITYNFWGVPQSVQKSSEFWSMNLIMHVTFMCPRLLVSVLNLTKCDKMWQMWQNVAKFGKMWQNLAKCGKSWQNVTKCVKMWQVLRAVQCELHWFYPLLSRSSAKLCTWTKRSGHHHHHLAQADWAKVDRRDSTVLIV